ncbi:MAG TPA: aminotransferase class III-fold pyridoxal phosphate-dependent enzyme [Candidatus Binatia bacterium]|jgi:glutamate-1-semialdehyde 2,1-aminomutase|nr:aminotransferase class III-fold pyridoxal phosphate-dependent enzyme [Candidatus Binatia bacterium]
MEPGRYRHSEALFERALRVVPHGIYGHQSPRNLVPGAYPHFFARGAGARIWDVDGNEYLDLMCSYGPIVLGHNHPKVDAAARRQAEDGSCFNGPSARWVELAERLVELTPWAHWAVFAKNGSDVVTWATQVAREATGRKRILAAEGAYHGTHAWCSPRPGGLTPEDRINVVRFRYNDLASVDAALAAHHDDVAAIVISPFRHDAMHDQEMPAPGFLPGLRERCDRIGAALILDDVRAGFRLDMRGSGASVGVTPDLTCYCKALGNGYPIAAALGTDALRRAAEKVFFTGSYWFSAVEMAAALACLDELEATDAIGQMSKQGALLRDGMERQAATHGLAIHYTGPPAIPFMTFTADQGSFERSRTFAGACATRGVYLHPYHNWFLSAALDETDVARVLEVTDEAFRLVSRG